MENTLGLVMTGGGARRAYQAGVLKRIGELARVRTQGNPCPIIGDVSAGAINGLAATILAQLPSSREALVRSRTVECLSH
jgi:predicted acylesterase/phospholipase RssA